MSRFLGWKNIYYKRANVNTRKSALGTLPQRLLDQIETRNQLDIQLYEYAKKLFDKQVSEFPRLDLNKELQEFQSLNPTMGQLNHIQRLTKLKLKRTQTELFNLFKPS